ncbi:SMI1/KNR4 family protein [Kitasatospora indigofera]|uniref:SMI1/KNR4 family protein n=1 Tax=Kitasatospora indigofera TaxID=67307 RepID=UPI00368FA3F0
MTVERLAQLLGAPDRRPAQVPWEDSAAVLDGLRLPADYRWLVDTYGEIRIRSDFGIYGPRRDRGGFAAFRAYTADAYEQVELVHEEPRFPETPDRPPYEMLPEPGGLLPWGGDNRGNYVFWLTADPDQDRWPVVVWIQDLELWDVFPGGTTAFLAALITGEYHLGRELLGSDSLPLWEFEADWNGRGGRPVA